MACNGITDILVRETGRYLAEEIFKRTFAVSPWMTLMPRGTFPRGLGETINLLMYERNAPTVAAPSWTTVAVDDGSEGGACLAPAEKLSVGSTTRNFNLARRVLEGPDFCAEEIRTPFEVMQQLNAIFDMLMLRTRLEWEMRDRAEYFRLVQRKVVVDGCPPTNSNTSATTYPSACPTSMLTQGILDLYRMKLLRDGAGQFAMGRARGDAVLTLITSAETSDSIIRENADIRQDLRDAEPGMLIKALGASQHYRGFFHVIDPYPRRFECSGGTFTEVAPFTTEAATKGNRAIVSTAWETATYEESFIFSPSVMTQMVPQPITNPAPNYRFDPIRYTGMWTVKNILDRECNPDGNILYHRGILAAGSMPKHPEHGVAFVHRRCDPACNLIETCPT